MELEPAGACGRRVDGFEAERAQARGPGWERERVVERSERELPAVDPQIEPAADSSRQIALVHPLVRDLLPFLEGRDLGHVQDVLDVDAVARELDPAEAVDREVPERVCHRSSGSGERDDEPEQEDEALHDAYLLASGLQSTEKCGFSRTALTNHERDSCPRQRSIIPRWKYLSASCVPSRSARRE